MSYSSDEVVSDEVAGLTTVHCKEYDVDAAVIVYRSGCTDVLCGRLSEETCEVCPYRVIMR